MWSSKQQVRRHIIRVGETGRLAPLGSQKFYLRGGTWGTQYVEKWVRLTDVVPF